MKTTIFLSFLALISIGSLSAQKNGYWAETTSIDAFEVIESKVSRNINSPRANNTKFEFDCSDPANTYIRMHCVSCEVPLTLKLYSKAEDGYTKWIELKHGDKISIADCFEHHAEKTGLSGFFSNVKEMLYDFLGSFGNGRSARVQTPGLKSSTAIDPTDPKLEFLQTDYRYFISPEYCTVRFRNIENYQVKSIYIISHDGDLIFHAGDRSIIENIYDLTGKISPSIDSILKPLSSGENGSEYELNWNLVKKYLYGEFRQGQVYQLGVELESDHSRYNPYLINFQFFSDEELQSMENFISRD